ncbi:hypothetical protein GIB67_002545 [Kingdonia uniflora]|uniref:Benzyl alcohol O-benzoyltransferase n=1 Tax=Kingdonia uniflora TaxID=39325 RepID=A0A7J7N953_9MAGN|nr:hypothetical protein GIB67_002545 [Kingdonia uniflora]
MAPLFEFHVNIGEQEMIRPETSTPKELKYLSNIDDQGGLRNHIPFVHFYPPNSEDRKRDDVAAMIRVGLSKTLVHYYPIAGRLRKREQDKLVVDCCGEGVIFREAYADVTLADIENAGAGLKPPFPQWDRLLVDDVWGSHFITDSPLLRMQVTHLACGGFVLAYTFNHCVCDAYGALQFITAMSEYCKDPNIIAPSNIPSWGRELLTPRSPPRVSYPHPEYDLDDTFKTHVTTETDFKCLTQTSVFLSNKDISSLRHQISSKYCATFDAVATCLWRARTRTLLEPEAITKLLFPIDTRFRYNPSLPKGYYGSAVVFPCVSTKAFSLVQNPLSYTAKLISEVKRGVVGDEYRASVLDFIEVNGRRGFCKNGAFVVSDMTRLRFAEVDFGWGPGAYGGPGRAGTGMVPGMVTSIIRHKNEEGADGVLALVSLPTQALQRFHEEVRKCCAADHVAAISAL